MKRISCLSLLVASSAATLMTGCGMTSVSGSTSSPVTGNSIAASGRVMGGQQPVAGVAVQLYAAGSGSYGAAAIPLFPAGSITTTSAGNFTVPAFTCPTGNPDIFLVGTGGTPIGGSPNANLAMMVGLGPCLSINQTAFINVNEITTVATVWAVSGFMTGPTNIGSPASNKAGLDRAFAAINKLVTTTNGIISGPALPVGATLPVTEINALGNVLQNCINSAGGTASDTTDGYTTGTPCGKLFYLAMPQGGTAPADTITAAMNIAQHPSLPATSTPSYVAKLNSLQATSPAFSPALSVNAPPTDWTIAISYTGAGLNNPKALAIDTSGSVWVTSSGANGVVKLDNSGAGAGAVLPGFTGSGAAGIAIDQSGYAWVSSQTGNSIAKIDPTGATSTSYTGNGLTGPIGIAIDGAGDVWVANNGANTISAFTNSGAVFGSSPFAGGGITIPASIAINPK
jgi:hypothetical protein